MAKKYKSWREKLENPPVELPKVVEVPEKWRKSPRVEGFERALVKD